MMNHINHFLNLDCVQAQLPIDSVDETIETFEESFHRLSERHAGQHVVIVTHREGIRCMWKLINGTASYKNC